jgi:ABC-2 type transport system permease protein
VSALEPVAPAAAEAPLPAALPERARRPVPFLRAARVVFDLSLESMLWSRRSVFMGALLMLGVLFAVFYRVLLATQLPPRIGAFDLYGVVVAYYYVRHALPLAALFYASSLIADEVEARTITYLLTRPVRRASVLAGKFAAYLATTFALALPGLVVTFFLLTTQRGWRGVAGGAPDLLRDLGVAALALLAYGALFALMGVFLKRPLIPGLLFLYGWELLANLPGWAPRFTITAWLRSLLRHRPAGEGIGEAFATALAPASCLTVLGVVTVVCLALAGWIFARRQYVLDQ